MEGVEVGAELGVAMLPIRRPASGIMRPALSLQVWEFMPARLHTFAPGVQAVAASHLHIVDEYGRG